MFPINLSNQKPNHSNVLFVAPMIEPEKINVLKTIDTWIDNAKTKDSLPDKNPTVFFAAWNMYKMLRSSLQNTLSDKESNSSNSFNLFSSGEIFLCKDGRDCIQGIMEISEKTSKIYVNFLATHPNNLRSHLNEQEPNRVTGAGSLLLWKAKQIAVERGKKEVELQATSLSIGFYQKQGFMQPHPKSYWMTYQIDTLAQEKLNPAA